MRYDQRRDNSKRLKMALVLSQHREDAEILQQAPEREARLRPDFKRCAVQLPMYPTRSVLGKKIPPLKGTEAITIPDTA